MSRSAKKQEARRKQREQARLQAQAVAQASAARAESAPVRRFEAAFGTCWVSDGWDDTDEPDLVGVVVTRKLADGRVLPGFALVDRTCLGVKEGFAGKPLPPDEVSTFVARIGLPHGGMVECEPLVAQSIVFHALDYARKLGFAPHADFPAELFEPRPSQLRDTPWCAPERPLYLAGPYDDAHAVLQQLTAAVGEGNFDSGKVLPVSELYETDVKARTPTW
jgi:hypothetical protein